MFSPVSTPVLYVSYLQKLWILYLGNINISKITCAVKKTEQETAWEQGYGGSCMSEPSLSSYWLLLVAIFSAHVMSIMPVFLTLFYSHNYYAHPIEVATNYTSQKLCQHIVMTDPFGVLVSKLNNTFVNPTLKSSFNISIWTAYRYRCCTHIS